MQVGDIVHVPTYLVAARPDPSRFEARQEEKQMQVGDIVHVRGVVQTAGRLPYIKFDFWHTDLFVHPKDIVHVEPAQFKIGDKVQSKDGRVGTIRYIEDDWALVVETHKCKAIRYLIDLQRAPAQEGVRL